MDTMPPSEGGGAGSIPAEDTKSDFEGYAVTSLVKSGLI